MPSPLINIPQACEELHPVGVPSSREDWQDILLPWAAPWGELSEDLCHLLKMILPGIHNQVYARPSWPGGLCHRYCQILAEELSRRGIEVRVVAGLYSVEVHPRSTQAEIHQMIQGGELSEEALDYGNHMWLELEGVLVDPTAGQFLGPRAWDGMFDDDEPWSLDCYFPHSIHSGPFQGEWLEGKDWQEEDLGHYGQDWRRRTELLIVQDNLYPAV